jgi:hypothetical protein
MNVLISASKDLCKWLGIQPPRIAASPEGLGVGVQPVYSSTDTLAWQCHVVENVYGSQGRTIIAVESYSRYTLFLPAYEVASQQDFEMLLLGSWLTHIVDWLEKSPVSHQQILQLCQTSDNTEFTFEWVTNSDPSIRGHVSDAQLWISEYIEQERVSVFNGEHAYILGAYVNQLQKSYKGSGGKKQRFIPVERLLLDALSRFGGEGDLCLEQAFEPAPNAAPDSPLPDNVVSMAAFIERKRKQ